MTKGWVLLCYETAELFLVMGDNTITGKDKRSTLEFMSRMPDKGYEVISEL